MRIRTFVLSLATAGVAALAVFGAGASVADDAAPLSEAEQARVKTLIENLGSDEFRVREGATKELIALGEKARKALEQARDSDVPEVRFRADQVLRRLDGSNKEKPFAGGPSRDDAKPGMGSDPFGGWNQRFGDMDAQEWMKEFEKRMEEMRGQFGNLQVPFLHVFPGGVGRPARRHFTADGVELRVRADGGVRLSVTEKAGDDVSVTTVYDGKSLDAVLAARPELRNHAGVASVVEQRKKAEEEAKAAAERPVTPPFAFHSTTQGVTVESSPGRVKVTVTENGADGKPVSKTYEGTDLETLKKEHPELADKLGGITFRFDAGSGFAGKPGEPAVPGSPERPFRFGPDPVDVPEGATGPFGLGLRAAPEGKGLTVLAVRAGSDAAKLGLRTGDVLVSINGTAVTVDGPTSARDLIRAAKDGPMTVEILRDGKAMTLKR